MENRSGNQNLFRGDGGRDAPFTCLGKEFPNDEARRAHFTELLREKLKDPEFRNIEGFPLGEDEDILALSDPPYYTACPNPWINDFIDEWEKEKPSKPEGYMYHREPYAADVSEGKNDPIYNAHSYHTKVPHKAVMRYILHYTEPGDIVFDGFCGTGMTGVAAQMCGDRKTVESLGYRVDEDGTIWEKKELSEGKSDWEKFSILGARKAVLNDLSPAATFIAYNYNTPVNVEAFEREAKRILQEVEEECGWMYETKHTDGSTGKINYTVWSDVFGCPECSNEVIFWEAAVDKEGGSVLKEFPCPHCSTELTKRNMERAWITKYDSAIDETIRQAKQVPVLINYSIPGSRTRQEKTPDQYDLDLIDKIEHTKIPYWFPTEQMPEGYNTEQPKRSHGLTHIHHFYTKRNLWVLASILNLLIFTKNSRLLLWLTSSMIRTTKMYKFTLDRKMGTVSGTLYTPSLWTENTANKLLKHKIKILSTVQSPRQFELTNSSSLSYIISKDDSADYIFVDPPFGSNLNYSELNFLWESWLKVWTNNKPEAIENKVQGKGLREYRQLMTLSFKEAYRLLKPGRWMTVEFSNTSSKVYNAIQTALSEAGFIVSNVSSLDKKQGSFKAVTTPTAMKQDLVISAYKPNGGFEQRFLEKAHTPEGVWDFIRTHMKNLPVVKSTNEAFHNIPERDSRILFEKMVAYYIRHNFTVPLSYSEFLEGIESRFAIRDGMVFLPEQVDEYDKERMKFYNVEQLSLFVDSEESAIQWLKSELLEKPQKRQDLYTAFRQKLHEAKYENVPELDTLLEENFFIYDGNGEVPPQIHTYLSKNWKELRNLEKDDPALIEKAKGRWYVPNPNNQADLEKKRERALLKEFDHYKDSTKRLRLVRSEAVRAGFKKAYQDRDFQLIKKIGDKLPKDLLESDDKLLLIYDQAVTMLEE